jgi:hypothetical protein
MKIIHKNPLTFRELEVGQLFRYEDTNCVLMKIHPITVRGDHINNYMNIETTFVGLAYNDNKVIALSGELHILGNL